MAAGHLLRSYVGCPLTTPRSWTSPTKRQGPRVPAEPGSRKGLRHEDPPRARHPSPPPVLALTWAASQGPAPLSPIPALTWVAPQGSVPLIPNARAGLGRTPRLGRERFLPGNPSPTTGQISVLPFGDGQGSRAWGVPCPENARRGLGLPGRSRVSARATSPSFPGRRESGTGAAQRPGRSAGQPGSPASGRSARRGRKASAAGRLLRCSGGSGRAPPTGSEAESGARRALRVCCTCPGRGAF